MILPLVLGCLVGVGIMVVQRALAPPSQPLGQAITNIHRRPDLVEIAITDDEGLGSNLGRRLSPRFSGLLARTVINSDRLQADLALVGRAPEHHYGEKLLLAVFGFVLPTLTALVMALGGAGFGLASPLFVGLILAAVFSLVPDLTLRSQAEERRDDFKHSLGSFLDLVVIGLAGGAGVESALADAAGIGDSWAFEQLRNALAVSRLTGETPWAALARLGEELGVPELAELAASVSLAGTEGARVRESLSAKAESIRDHAMAEQEASANSETEKMALPVVLLFFGFLILIGYPAIDAVLTGI